MANSGKKADPRATLSETHIDKLYKAAWSEFNTYYKKHSAKAIEALHPELSANAVYSILAETKPDQTRNYSTKLAIIDLMTPEVSPRLYQRLGRAMGHPTKNLEKIFTDTLQSKKSVKFRYFRFFKNPTQPKPFVLNGYIYCKCEIDTITFRHSILRKNQDEVMMHSGFLYLPEGRMTMFAWRPQVFRLAVFSAPPDQWKPSTDLLHGGLLSISDKKNPYLARCVIAHEQHPFSREGMDKEMLRKLLRHSTDPEHGLVYWD